MFCPGRNKFIFFVWVRGFLLYLGNGCIVLQGKLHHLFVQMMKYAMAVIASERTYLMEFSVDARRRILSVSFLERNELVCMPIGLCGGDVPLSISFVLQTSQLLSDFERDATIVSCGASNVDFIKVLDKSRGRKAGIQ